MITSASGGQPPYSAYLYRQMRRVRRPNASMEESHAKHGTTKINVLDNLINLSISSAVSHSLSTDAARRQPSNIKLILIGVFSFFSSEFSLYGFRLWNWLWAPRRQMVESTLGKGQKCVYVQQENGRSTNSTQIRCYFSHTRIPRRWDTLQERKIVSHPRQWDGLFALGVLGSGELIISSLKIACTDYVCVWVCMCVWAAGPIAAVDDEVERKFNQTNYYSCIHLRFGISFSILASADGIGMKELNPVSITTCCCCCCCCAVAVAQCVARFTRYAWVCLHVCVA